MCNEEEKDMTLTLDVEKNEQIKVNSAKFKSKVPHLKIVNGSVQIDGNDTLQKKWFEEFKK
jgi:enoyl-[acyl-carrier-protein] reductase (NADH)